MVERGESKKENQKKISNEKSVKRAHDRNDENLHASVWYEI
jgi:hypothetical protein